MTNPPKRTALHAWHVEHGARMAPFAGWEMPIQYPTGPLEEHHTTRRAAGLFDIDHMGQIEIGGPDAVAFVNHVLTYDVRRLKPFRAHYTLLCYQDGGTADDPIVYRLADRSDQPTFWLAVNAANTAKDLAWLRAQATGFDVDVRDLSDVTCMFALQGPLAAAIMARVVGHALDTMPRFGAATATLPGDVPLLLSRTGYTGEDGFELFLPVEHAGHVWEAILDAGAADGVKPIGLAARDSLRFEACMPLYGHELGPQRTPIEAGLHFGVSLGKDFIGRDALLKQELEGPAVTLAGFEMAENGVPRHGYSVTHDGDVVGAVTSGMFSPTTGRYLGMAYLPANLAAIDTRIEIVIHGRPRQARVVERPFYVPAYRR
jgi:aminomethyltransferase